MSKIIIIGGGIAGLSAGVFGQKYGFETEIFEMHSVPRGQCTHWRETVTSLKYYIKKINLNKKLCLDFVLQKVSDSPLSLNAFLNAEY